MNNNNNNSVAHNPSEDNDGSSIGDIDVDDIPKLYNSLCHAPTGGTDNNHCWCFDNNLAFNRNNMINNNEVGPSPLCSNEGSSTADNFLECTFLCHTSISDAIGSIQLTIVPPSLKGGVGNVMEGNNNSNIISHVYGHSDCPTEANVDNSTEANSHNEQTTIKTRTNNHNEWWYCFGYNYIDIERNNMNNNNNINVDHDPSQNIDGGSIGYNNVVDIPKSYNFLCHATTGGTDSNHYWCFSDDPISKHNNMINNTDVDPIPLYNNEGGLIEDDIIPEYIFLYHTFISDADNNSKLITVSSSLNGGVRKVMKGNNNINSISPIYDHSNCHPNEANVNNSNKSDSTSNDGTTVQPLVNTWVPDEVSNSINNNNNNSFNRNNNNNNNDNNILTSNEYNENRHNNIEIDNNTFITSDLKINGATSNCANNNDRNSNSEINCFYGIPNNSQHAKARMNLEVMCTVIDSTMYNGDGMRKCSHFNNNTTINNKNTNTISTTPKRPKVGVQGKAMIDFVVAKDCLSLFRCRNNSSNTKTDHPVNSNNDISELIFADINTIPGSDTGDDSSRNNYNDGTTEANDNNEQND